MTIDSHRRKDTVSAFNKYTNRASGSDVTAPSQVVEVFEDILGFWVGEASSLLIDSKDSNCQRMLDQIHRWVIHGCYED